MYVMNFGYSVIHSNDMIGILVSLKIFNAVLIVLVKVDTKTTSILCL